MRTKIQRLALLAVVMGGLLVMALSAPASAANTQISGVGVADTAGACGSPPPRYADFTDFTLVMTGSLEGCWYTKIDTATDHGAPSGVYHETGREVFVGSLNGIPSLTRPSAAVFLDSFLTRYCTSTNRIVSSLSRSCT